MHIMGGSDLQLVNRHTTVSVAEMGSSRRCEAFLLERLPRAWNEDTASGVGLLYISGRSVIVTRSMCEMH